MIRVGNTREAGVTVLPWRFVLLDNVGGDAATAAERDAVIFRPRPDVRAASTAGR
jgi:hypothetical protein